MMTRMRLWALSELSGHSMILHQLRLLRGCPYTGLACVAFAECINRVGDIVVLSFAKILKRHLEGRQKQPTMDAIITAHQPLIAPVHTIAELKEAANQKMTKMCRGTYLPIKVHLDVVLLTMSPCRVHQRRRHGASHVSCTVEKD